MPAKPKERRKVYNERKESGLCPRCGKRKKKSKFSFCDDCRAYYRSYNLDTSDTLNEARKLRYHMRKDNHQCPRCGKKLGKRYTKTMCPVCLEKQYNYNYR